MNYFGNGFGPQYGAGMPQNNYGMQTPQRCEVIRVNGRNGADAFRLAPNSSILMLDENEPLVWLKTTDGAAAPLPPFGEKVCGFTTIFTTKIAVNGVI